MMDSLEVTDIGNLQTLIDNYEYLIQDLTYEIQTFQIEYNDLNNKIRNVISENEKLSKDITSVISNHKFDNNTTQNISIENLKRQLNLISTEKDYTLQLWQNAVTTIKHFEKELNIYKKNGNDYVSKDEIIKLKTECNSKIKTLEDQLGLAKSAIFKTETANYNKTNEVAYYFKQDSSAKIIQNLEEEILALQQRLKQSNKTKDELNKTIIKQNKRIKYLEEKNKEYVEKVNEAVQVVEAACIEKDVALLREREAKDEITKVSKTLLDVLEQAETKIKSEVDQVKSDFNDNLKNALQDLKKAHSDSVIKQSEIDTYAKQCVLLENEIERLQSKKSQPDISEHTSKLLILEKNLERTFQKLLTSEKENIILNAELSRVKTDMNNMIGQFENDIKTREIEKTTLQNKIQHMKNERTDSDKKYLELMENLEEVKGKLLEMKQKFKEEMSERQKELLESHMDEINSVKTKNESNIKLVEDQLCAQMQLNRRWRSETKLMVANLEGKIRYQNDRMSKLNQLNWNLKRKIKGKVKQQKKIHQDITVLTSSSQIETRIKSPKKEE